MSKQSTDTLKRVLTDAKNEIISLRRKNEILAARDDVVQIFAMALRAYPPQQGWGVDGVINEINDVLKEIDKDKTDAGQ